MWYVLDRNDEVLSAHETETKALGAAEEAVERMALAGEFRACVFVVTKAHLKAAEQAGESPRRWRDYKTGGAVSVRPGVSPVCR